MRGRVSKCAPYARRVAIYAFDRCLDSSTVAGDEGHLQEAGAERPAAQGKGPGPRARTRAYLGPRKVHGRLRGRHAAVRGLGVERQHVAVDGVAGPPLQYRVDPTRAEYLAEKKAAKKAKRALKRTLEEAK